MRTPPPGDVRLARRQTSPQGRSGPAAVEGAAQVAHPGVGVLPGDEVAAVVMGVDVDVVEPIDRSRLFPGVNDSGRRFFSITTKISRRDPRPCPHEYHPPIVYTPRSTRCSPPVTTWRPPWS